MRRKGSLKNLKKKIKLLFMLTRKWKHKITKIFDPRLKKTQKTPKNQQTKPNHPQNKKNHRTLTVNKKQALKI